MERRDALLVPNTALRYTPGTTAAPAAGNSVVSSPLPRLPRGSGERRASTGTTQVRQVGVLDNTPGAQPRAVPAAPGAGDGRLTEVTMMGGVADTWTPFAPCQHMASLTRDRSDPSIPFELVEYPHGTHSWDNVKGTRIMETEKGTLTLGWDKDASADSMDRAIKFFRSNMKL